MLDQDYDITQLTGADYNPRRITDEQLEKLRESVTRLGVIKPIIARNGTIVAGHQRSKALLRLGITTAPVFLLGAETTTCDEMTFNQLHNGTDLDQGDEAAHFIVDESLSPGYHAISSDVFRCNYQATGAPIRATIASLIEKFGNWGACVCNSRGEVIHAAQYAIAASLACDVIHVYVVNDEDEMYARETLALQYGRFNYESIERETYVQTMAQPPRKIVAGRPNLGRLYRYRVRPYLEENPGLRVLDFGAGRGDCARQMRDLGHNITELEFFRRNGWNEIHPAAVHRMISKVESEIKKKGPFDVTVCQAVLNSVDSLEAEDAVLLSLSALTRMGGTLFITGRSLEEYHYFTNLRCGAGSQRLPPMLDENNFEAKLHHGQWFFQKYHALGEIKELVASYGFKIREALTNDNQFSGYWLVVGEKEAEMPRERVKKALQFEFNLKWPDGKSVGRDKTILEAFGFD